MSEKPKKEAASSLEAPASFVRASASSQNSQPASVQASPQPTSSDVMLVHGVSEDGKSLAVLRARNNTLEAGVVRALADGEPIHGEVVQLKPRPECPVVCDVQVTVPRMAPAPRATDENAGQPASAKRALARTGPAQVATASYRDNWDAIWQKSARTNSPGGNLPN